MEKFRFIDRFFHSQYELLDFTQVDDRDSNSLYTFLNNLHTTADRLKEDFDCDIKSSPDFKILRLIRNYFHHVGDVEEIRLKVVVEPDVLVSHSEHLLIPLETFAKSVKSFIENNTLPEKSKNFRKKQDFIAEEMSSISEIFDYTQDLLANLEVFCHKPSLKLDGTIYELGFDMYKFVYNITNIVADKCRTIDVLKNKSVVLGLDESYTSINNIGKHDVFCHPDNVPITTTEGFVYAKSIEATI
ncbi:hypothetical protein WH43_18185 [Rheinheimera sp. KL1]|uniref:hypothetical protein n=1 Tax=Rheinheimera sp. KL1 TaxID=1635005 RepID=UPI0006A9E42B|nr:hypothetical protein [Rheinheimera sp. KL1]KOO56793.1 hypothetical protein WH43_18185 [Rheinheimera sp. KL1]